MMTLTNPELNIISVADGPRVSLALACHMLVSKKSCPDAKYHVAVPKGRPIQHSAAEEVITKLATNVYEIPAPTTVIDGKFYPIENKINAVKYFENKPVILIDSDLIFMQPLPVSFLLRPVPAAVPEHGLHEFPWKRLFESFALYEPKITTILGSNVVSPPWLNAGFVSIPDAKRFGHLWKMASEYVLSCDWVPERWPYLDQISLPIAIALFCENRTVDHSNILPRSFNENIFYWHPDQTYAANSFVIHHHYRVGLMRRYIPNILTWVGDGNPIFQVILNDLSKFDDDAKPVGA